MTGPSTFFLLNQSGSVRQPQDWNTPSRDKLWLYNLHYFNDLNTADAISRNEWHRALIRQWIQQNIPGHGNGWEPYPTSIRIVNWIKWALRCNKVVEDEMLQSLAVQARWLRKRLEYHLLGNHLAANAKALIFTGLFFFGKEADDWLNTGIAILKRELQEQVLQDGGHFERSPMYHAIILEDILDLLNIISLQGNCVAYDSIVHWRDTAARMLVWLRLMTHPDGEIAFFNDAAFGVASNYQELFAYAKRLGIRPCESKKNRIQYLEDSGYLRLESEGTVVLLDVAPLGPDYLLSHAHADTFSFELSVSNQRVIVNSGTSLYKDDRERLRQRGTAAHSTVVIDGINSSEVWGSFRVAKRAVVSNVIIMGEDSECVKIYAEHDGYSTLKGAPTHRRTWEFFKNAMVIIDEVGGDGFHQIELAFHLHPDIRVLRKQQDVVELTDSNSQWLCTLKFDGSGQVSISPSTYHPEFNMTIENLRISYECKGNLPKRFVTNILWA